jgi:hypothetical protein
MDKWLEDIREKISCPQFGDEHYGAWGILNKDQRFAIKRMLDFIEGQEAYINRLQAENERLNKEVDRLSQVVLYNDGVTEMKVEEAKAEAYKEFAEKLNKEAENVGIDREGNFIYSDSDNTPFEIYDTVAEWCKDVTDNLLKELVGGNDV